MTPAPRSPSLARTTVLAAAATAAHRMRPAVAAASRPPTRTTRPAPTSSCGCPTTVGRAAAARDQRPGHRRVGRPRPRSCCTAASRCRPDHRLPCIDVNGIDWMPTTPRRRHYRSRPTAATPPSRSSIDARCRSAPAASRCIDGACDRTHRCRAGAYRRPRPDVGSRGPPRRTFSRTRPSALPAPRARAARSAR